MWKKGSQRKVLFYFQPSKKITNIWISFKKKKPIQTEKSFVHVLFI